jgi:hypothetical protein
MSHNNGDTARESGGGGRASRTSSSGNTITSTSSTANTSIASAASISTASTKDESVKPAGHEHILWIDGFTDDFQSHQLGMVLTPLTDAGAEIQWVNPGKEAMAVFSTPAQAAAALRSKQNHSFIRVQAMGVKKAAELGSLPGPHRPKSTISAASRMIGHGLGVKVKRVPKPKAKKKNEPLNDAW